MSDNNGIAKDRATQLAAARKALLQRRLQESAQGAVDTGALIPPRPPECVLPLSSGQMRLWYLSQFDDGLAIYNIVTALKLIGKLDQGALQASINAVIARHEALRMYFRESTQTEDDVEVAIEDNLTVEVLYRDLQTGPEEQLQQRLEDTLRELSLMPFDLQTAPLIRVHCLGLGPTEHVLVISVHHAVFDGVSQNIFLSEMFEHFAAQITGNVCQLPAPALQYGDYSLWQQQYFESPALQQQRAYWLEQLSGELPILDLPADKPRQPRQSFAGSSATVLLEPELLAALEQLAARNNSTLYMLMLAVFYTLLYRYSGQRDCIVGTPIAGRNQPQLQNAIGYFVNTLPLRARIDEQQPFTSLLQQVRDTCLSAYENQDVPFELIVKDLKPERDLSRTPVFQALFGFQLFDDINTGIADLRTERVPMDVYLSRTDLAFWHERDATGMYVCAEYCTELFEQTSIRGMLSHYKALLQAVLNQGELCPARLPMLLPEDYRQLQDFNDTDADYQRQATVVDLLRQQVELHRNKSAVVSSEASLGYWQLEQASNQLANHLQAHGVCPGACVGLCLDRSIDLLVAALAIWKAGAAYVPLDPAFPRQRLLYMLESAGVDVLVTESKLQALLQDHDCQRILLDTDAAAIAGRPAAAPVVNVVDKALAYVIFTSGSTGKPKGVKIPHRALTNFLTSMARQPGLMEQDKLLAVTTLSFDIAALELYLPLCVGATVFIASKEDTADGLRLRQLLDQYSISVMQATPASWHLLLAAGWRGDSQFKVLCGGEALPQDLAQALLARAGEVWNMYGPTETTVWSTCYRVTPNGPTLIGQPIANTRCHVLDGQQQPVALGVAGELYIGGDGLSDGYLGRPELTAERFISDPFDNSKDARLYRTGDRVRWRRDGQLEYLQRLDNQVKLRGFRIELGEIEQALSAHPRIRECAAGVLESGDSDQRLAAWLCFDGDRVDHRQLRQFLRAILPDYMVPQLWVELDKMPLTANGKIDRKALPRPDSSHVDHGARVEPATALERQLAAIWCDLLTLDTVGVSDDFFDLGGHSLLGTRLFAKINHKFGVFLGLHELFRSPTIRQLAERIEQATVEPEQRSLTISHSDDEAESPASSQQQRLWYLSQIHPTHQTHNLSAAWRLRGVLNIEALQQAFNALLLRHEALCSRIVSRDGRIIQQIQRGLTLDLGPKHAIDPALASLQAMLESRRELPFPLTGEPLIRAGLIEIDAEDHLLYIVVHHLVFDGQSFSIFYHDLFQLYQHYQNGLSHTLAELPINYRDYARWQQPYTASEQVQTQLAYWLEHLAGELPILDLPLDKPRPSEQPWQSNSVSLSLDEPLVRNLQHLAVAQGCSLFMVMACLYAITLYRFSRQSSVVVGIPISGRNLDELQSLIGFFVNTLALRLEVDPQQSFLQCLSSIKQACLDAYNHPDLPFDLLVQALNPPRDQSRSPIYQTLFTYIDSSQALLPVEGLQILPFELDLPGAQTDLDFWLERLDDGIRGGMEYPVALFEASTVQAIAGSFELLAQRVSQTADSSLAELLQLARHEQQTLENWNNSARDYPRNKVFTSHLTALCAERSGQRALQFGSISVDYPDLEVRSNQLAHYLRAAGVDQNCLVGVCLQRSHELLITLLAIWKTGAAYVPLDATYPEQRLRYMLETAAVPALVTESLLIDTVADYPCRRICVDTEQQAIARQSKVAPTLQICPESIAYVIFTSGSSGKPKGVQVPHRAVMNFLHSMAREPGLNSQDILLAVTTLSFDIAVLELYLPLLVGATVVIADSEQAADGEQIKTLLSEHQVTAMQATPGSWRLLLAAGWQGRSDFKVLCGGEAFPLDLAGSLLARAEQVWNLYGPTETTVWSTCYRVNSDSEPVTIGHPIANTQCHVLDEQRQPVPIGVSGELYIGGDGVASGYLARPELNAERFVSDPYRDDPKARMYRTGDQVRWRQDGRLEYFRRMDDQIKMRGFRIELGEVESVLTAHPQIAQATAILRSYGNTDQRLVAYVCFESGASMTNTELRRYLREQLPHYMIPQLFVELDAIPLTANGKVNRQALPEPFQSVDQAQQHTAPGTGTERQIADIWREVLQVEEFGVDQHFFDIGGHSLLALEVIYRLETRFGIKITPLDILLNSLGQIAARIDRQRPPDVPEPTVELDTGEACEGNIIRRLFNRKRSK